MYPANNLLEVVRADRALGLCLGPADCREQQGGEYGEDCNDHEQLDQGECSLRFHIKGFITAGGLSGSVKTGRVLDYGHDDGDRKLCSLYLGLMDRMNVRLDHFGDADTRLASL